MADPAVPPLSDDNVEELAAVLMHRWGCDDTDQDAYDAACADIRAMEAAGWRLVAADRLAAAAKVVEAARKLAYCVYAGPPIGDAEMDEPCGECEGCALAEAVAAFDALAQGQPESNNQQGEGR